MITVESKDGERGKRDEKGDERSAWRKGESAVEVASKASER